MIHIEKFIFNFFEENTYVVSASSGTCVLMDPGCYSNSERTALQDYIKRNSLIPRAILLTHAHPDHSYGAGYLSALYGGIPVYMDPRENLTIRSSAAIYTATGVKAPEEFTAVDAEDATTLDFGEFSLRALSTPGHTAGGLCWLVEDEKVIFTGDTLFKGCIGRTDFGGGSLDNLLHSLRNVLMRLDGDIDIYPGHGPVSSIAVERQTNPFIYGDDVPEDGRAE